MPFEQFILEALARLQQDFALGWVAEAGVDWGAAESDWEAAAGDWVGVGRVAD